MDKNTEFRLPDNIMLGLREVGWDMLLKKEKVRRERLKMTKLDLFKDEFQAFLSVGTIFAYSILFLGFGELVGLLISFGLTNSFKSMAMYGAGIGIIFWVLGIVVWPLVVFRKTLRRHQALLNEVSSLQVELDSRLSKDDYFCLEAYKELLNKLIYKSQNQLQFVSHKLTTTKSEVSNCNRKLQELASDRDTASGVICTETEMSIAESQFVGELSTAEFNREQAQLEFDELTNYLGKLTSALETVKKDSRCFEVEIARVRRLHGYSKVLDQPVNLTYNVELPANLIEKSELLNRLKDAVA